MQEIDRTDEGAALFLTSMTLLVTISDAYQNFHADKF